MKTDRINEVANNLEQGKGSWPEELNEPSRRKKRLVRKEKLFNSILDNTSLGYAVIDETGQFLLYNRLFLKLFGLSESSSIKNVNDQNWSEWQVYDENFEILHVDNHPVRKAARTGMKVKNQLVGVKNPSGDTLTWMLISADPIIGEEGKIERIICTYQDITLQRFADEALRKSEQRYRQLFNSITEMFQVIELIHDDQGKAIDFYYRDINPAFEKMVGKTREQLINRRAKEVIEVVEDYWIEMFDKVYKDNQSIHSDNFSSALNKMFQVSAWKTFENYVGVILSDITGQMAAREQQRINEELFRSVLDNSRDIIARSNLQTGIYEYVSPSIETITGYPVSEFVGKNTMNLLSKIHPDDFPKVREVFEHAAQTGEAEVEYRLQVRSGDYIWASNHISVVHDAAGTPAFRISVIRDITQSKKAAEALIESEQKLKYHFENSPLAIIEWDTRYKVIQWSKEAERLFGWKKEEVIGKSINELNMVFEEDLPVLNRTIQRLSGGKERTVVSNNRNYSKAGSIIECNWYNSILTDNHGTMTSVLSLVEDITERKQQELKLRESEEKYKELIENARSAIVKLDTEGRITFFNEYAQQLFGFTEEEIIGKNVIDTIVPKVDAEGTRMEPFLEDLYKNPDYYHLNINENIKKTGERIWVEWHNRALFNNQGQRAGHIAIGVDITARRQAEEKLKHSEARYRRLFESARDGILILDADSGQIIDANPYLAEMLEYSQEEFLGKQLWDIGFSKNADQTKASFIELQHEGYIRYDDIPLETKRGKSLNVEFVSNVYHVDDKKVIQCNIRDITERKISEKALVESERQLRELNASKDKFFSIVTHDLKSPFTSIVGFSELLEEKIRNKDYTEIEEFTSIINKSSMRVMDLLKNLIEWSRLQTGRMEFNRKETDLVAIIDEVTDLLYASARQKAILITKQVPPHLHVMADRQMVGTVIRNLISNAIKFTKPGGNIDISVVAHPDEIFVSVSDDGIGIMPDVIGKLFSIEANISTPGTLSEEGTGLGLLLCKEFIAKHGGRIWVESQIQKGSRFMFTLPSGKTN